MRLNVSVVLSVWTQRMPVDGVCMVASVMAPLISVPSQLESTIPSSWYTHTLHPRDSQKRFSLTLSVCVFLQLGDSSSAVDVCPVVNSAPTPSGHYTQPVGVARSLILFTSNLPPPVSPPYSVEIGFIVLSLSLSLTLSLS